MGRRELVGEIECNGERTCESDWRLVGFKMGDEEGAFGSVGYWVGDVNTRALTW